MKTSAVFRNFLAAAILCGLADVALSAQKPPNIVVIMTGIYNNRNYLRFGILDPTQVTFAKLLRDAGYVTAIGGKWQLGGDYEGVKNFGFDRHCLWQLNRRPSRYANPGLEIDGERKDFKNGEFGPDIVNGYLCDFIRSQKGKDRPFLVYYPHAFTAAV